jgi:hypothetical protein
MRFSGDDMILIAFITFLIGAIISGFIVYYIQEAVYRCKHQFELIQDDKVDGITSMQHTTVYMCKNCAKTKVIKTVTRK